MCQPVPPNVAHSDDRAEKAGRPIATAGGTDPLRSQRDVTASKKIQCQIGGNHAIKGDASENAGPSPYASE